MGSPSRQMFDEDITYPSRNYKVVDNDQKFQMMLDIPGVKEEDIDIKLDDGKITVQGQRVSTSDHSHYSFKFSQSFNLDPTVDVDKFTATLNDGVLVISAPKDVTNQEENVRRIPITAQKDVHTDKTKRIDDEVIDV